MSCDTVAVHFGPRQIPQIKSSPHGRGLMTYHCVCSKKKAMPSFSYIAAEVRGDAWNMLRKSRGSNRDTTTPSTRPVSASGRRKTIDTTQASASMDAEGEHKVHIKPPSPPLSDGQQIRRFGWFAQSHRCPLCFSCTSLLRRRQAGIFTFHILASIVQSHQPFHFIHTLPTFSTPSKSTDAQVYNSSLTSFSL